MIILLVILLVVLFGMLGFGFSGYFIIRKNFFNSLSSFLMEVKTNVNFNSKRVTEILSNNSNRNKNVYRLLENYSNSLARKDVVDKDILFDGISFLTEQEKESIFVFFSSLGKVDIFNQVEQIDCFIKTFSEYYDSSKKQCDKKCSLYTKLGILLGLFVALLII